MAKRIGAESRRLKWTRVSLALVVSTLLWLLVKLGGSYETRISWPVSYNTFTQQFKVHSQLPSTIEVEVRGRGYPLALQSWTKNQNTLEVDLRNYADQGYVPADFFQEQLKTRLQEGVQIQRIRPETLRFALERKVAEKVPIHAQVRLPEYSSYLLAGAPRVLPDSVTLIGAKQDLAAIEYWTTYEHEIQQPDELMNFYLRTRQDSSILATPQRVQVQLQAYRCAEHSFEVPVQVFNNQSGEAVRLLPNRITVTAQLPLAEIRELQATDFEVGVDFNNIQAGADALRPQVLRQPNNARNLRFSPPVIRYVRQLPS